MCAYALHRSSHLSSLLFFRACVQGLGLGGGGGLLSHMGGGGGLMAGGGGLMLGGGGAAANAGGANNSGGGNASDSVILEEEFDPNYEPTEEEIIEYAQFLQMDLDADKDLFWIAREGLKAPLPEPWKPCRTETNEVYYFNFNTGESVWEHPCDEVTSRNRTRGQRDARKTHD